MEGLNKYSLTFQDKEIENRWRAYSRQHIINYIKWFILTVIGSSLELIIEILVRKNITEDNKISITVFNALNLVLSISGLLAIKYQPRRIDLCILILAPLFVAQNLIFLNGGILQAE